MNASQIGNVGEAAILSLLVSRGIPCYLPYGDGNLCDLIADFNGKLNKIQIKTVAKRKDAGSIEWKITHQEGFHGNRVTYNIDDFDYFGLYCIENGVICFVKNDKNTPKSAITIRTDKTERTVILNTMRFAEDYSIDAILNDK